MLFAIFLKISKISKKSSNITRCLKNKNGLKFILESRFSAKFQRFFQIKNIFKFDKFQHTKIKIYVKIILNWGF